MKMTLYRLSRKFKWVEYWVIAQLTLALLKIISWLPAKGSLNFLEKAARKIGPWTPRHRVALNNLELAFPHKTQAERDTIALEMWGNMGRLLGEYVFLDQLFDFDPENPDAGHIEVEGVDLFTKLVNQPDRPAFFFTGHMGNFELLPIAAAAYGLEINALFRPPNNPILAKKLMQARTTSMGHMVPSRTGAALEMGRILADGGKVGMLIDQKFIRGIKTQFFDHPCVTNPLPGRLIRNFECDVYPSKCIRLPNGKFRLTLYDAIEIPRLENGQVDPHSLVQKMTSEVESWVRANPGQWMWFHKRWAHVDTARKSK